MATEGGGGATVGDPEGFKNRRETRRGTHWASASTVIAAVIGAVVGSLGGAYLGVTIGADRDDERSEREFWRTERVKIYGEFLAATNESRSLMEGYLNFALTETSLTATFAEYPAPPADLLTDVGESMRRVDTLAGQISFIGEDVALAAGELQEELVGAYSLIGAVAQCHSDDTNNFPCDTTVSKFRLPGAEDDWWSLRQFESERDNLMQAAQEQLEAPD